MSADPLPTVTENDAEPTIAAVYADIRQTMGVALVNLIWRHLATSPKAFHWAWSTLRPIYASGAVPHDAALLRDSLVLPKIAPFSANELAQLDIDASATATVAAVLRTYELGNSQNLIALCALRAALGQPPATPIGGAQQLTAERGDGTNRTPFEKVLPIPALPSLEGLSGDILQQIRGLSAIGAPSNGADLIPSAYRHLAHWPKFLLPLRERLEAMNVQGQTLRAYIDAAILSANSSALTHLPALDNERTLDEAHQRWLCNGIDLFIETMIGRMTIIVPVILQALPQSEEIKQ